MQEVADIWIFDWIARNYYVSFIIIVLSIVGFVMGFIVFCKRLKVLVNIIERQDRQIEHIIHNLL